MTKNSVTEANRDLDKLAPEFRKKVEGFLSDPRIKDDIFITEGYRSQERQNYLYNFSIENPSKAVTWTLNSNHTKGLAIDIAFNGKELYPSNFNKWEEVSDVAKEYGIDWGYDLWKTDKPHFQDNLNIKYMPDKKENRYTDLLSTYIENGYSPIFEKLEGDKPLTEAETKTLIEIAFAAFLNRLNNNYNGNKQ